MSSLRRALHGISRRRKRRRLSFRIFMIYLVSNLFPSLRQTAALRRAAAGAGGRGRRVRRVGRMEALLALLCWGEGERGGGWTAGLPERRQGSRRGRLSASAAESAPLIPSLRPSLPQHLVSSPPPSSPAPICDRRIQHCTLDYRCKSNEAYHIDLLAPTGSTYVQMLAMPD